jgi:SNF2 family DNA or RNA helicase
MCKRELGGELLDEHMRLWRLERNSGGKLVYAAIIITTLAMYRSHLPIRYRHSITKAESLQPQREAQGGVIADEMGLGKTLTTISLIAVSLPRAAHFSSTIPSQSFSQSSAPLPRSRATLVVVPSTRSLHCVLFSGYPQLTWKQN